ncbi:MAG: hypothetical protein U0736_19965 [Gemmataceae bacterium]
MVDRLVSCLMAVSLALLIWLYTRSRDHETLDNVTVPVEVVLTARQAEGYTLELTGQRQVGVSFTGAVQRIRELQMILQRKELRVVKTVTVPDERLTESRLTDAVTIEGSDLNAPPGVTPIVKEGHNRVTYTLHRLIERRLPVRFDHVRETPTGPVLLDPPTVLVKGPQELLDRMSVIPTEPSELPTRPLHSPPNVAAIGRVPVMTELEGRPIKVNPPRVVVRVPGQARKLYELADVPVTFLCPANFPLRPKFIDERAGKVTLKLYGPIQDEPPKIYAFVDLSKGKFVSGLNHEPLQLQLPRDFQLTQDAPRVIAFELLPGDFVPDGLAPPSTTPPPPAGSE